MIKWLWKMYWIRDYATFLLFTRFRKFISLKSIFKFSEAIKWLCTQKTQKQKTMRIFCGAREKKKCSIKWGFTKLNKITSHKLYNSVNVRCSWSRIILATDNISLPFHLMLRMNIFSLIWFYDGFFPPEIIFLSTRQSS
jgi:hypothetical protein